MKSVSQLSWNEASLNPGKVLTSGGGNPEGESEEARVLKFETSLTLFKYKDFSLTKFCLVLPVLLRYTVFSLKSVQSFFFL